MATKVNDIMTVMASGTVSGMKAQKEQKAAQAFNSFLDSATRGSVNTNIGKGLDDGQSVKKDAATNQNADKRSNAGSQKSSNDAKATVRSDQKTDAAQSKTEMAQTNQTMDEEKAIAEQDASVLEAISAMLGMTPQQLETALQQFDQQIKEIVAEGLGISLESLEQMMQQLDLSAADLLESNNLMNVIVQSNGLEDAGAVLTNETLFQQFKDINQELSFAVNDFVQEQPVSAEQLQQLMQPENRMPQLIVTAEAAPQLEATVPIQMEEQDAESVMQPIDGNSTAQETDASLLTVADDKHKFTRQDFAESEQHFNHNAAMGTQTAQQIVSNIAEAAAETVYASADMEEIVNQIVEQIKLQFHADSTSMEMQLNPESLGKVHLQVIVKEGAVTAQIAVENEAVRHALESQAITLKENMNNQGVKVEAIEVTIASHEFERNLQQENNPNQQAYEQEQAAAARRRVNLNLDALEEEDLQQMTEAESLERKIMIESGNRISFQA